MPCRTSLARPDKARRINIFYLSAAAGAEWCCQIVQGGAESLGLCGAVSGAVQAGRQGRIQTSTWAVKVESRGRSDLTKTAEVTEGTLIVADG